LSRVLFYQIKPKSDNGKYERSNYIHPLYSLNGNVITEDFPPDHPHHHGIFWSWHQVLHNDTPIADSWMSENISWEVIHSKIKNAENAVVLDNEVLWKSSLAGKEVKAIVRENSRIMVHRAKEQYRIIDFDIRLTPLVENLKIGGSDDEKGYGGFSLRFKLPRDIRFLSRDKEVIAQEHALQAGPWLDFFGAFDGNDAASSGVAVFSHRSNPGQPQPWILRKEKSMQNPAFPGRVAAGLPSEGWRFRYRLVIHGNKIDVSDIERLYQEYSSI
jgi:hypothetical protein